MSETTEVIPAEDRTLAAMRHIAVLGRSLFDQEPSDLSQTEWNGRIGGSSKNVWWIWFVPGPSGDVNRGFRCTRWAARQRLEAWGRGTRIDMTLDRGDLADLPGLEQLVITVIGSSLRNAPPRAPAGL